MRKASTHVVRLISVLVLLLPSLDVGTLMDPDVSSQLVAPREPLVAPGVVAGVRLLSGMSSDMTSLIGREEMDAK